MNPPALSPGWFSVSTIVVISVSTAHIIPEKTAHHISAIQFLKTSEIHTLVKTHHIQQVARFLPASSKNTMGERELASLFKVETWGSIRDYQTINLPIWLFTSLLCTKVGEVESLGRHENVEMSRSHGCQVVPNFVGKIIQLLETQLVRHGVMVGVPYWLGMGAIGADALRQLEKGRFASSP